VTLDAVFGFPICTSLAMRHVEAVHASVIVGVLPLAGRMPAEHVICWACCWRCPSRPL